MPKIDSNENKEMVAKLSGLGLTHIQIASVLGISRTTLYKHYKEELDSGKAMCIGRVAENLYKMATGDISSRNTLGACIFYLKTQANWREVNTIEVTDGSENQAKFRQFAEAIQRTRLTDTESKSTVN
tara:strand:+ start:98 stop:481 length:384 start_codon:yes stop_codon:yes gene_type:complete